MAPKQTKIYLSKLKAQDQATRLGEVIELDYR